MRFVWFWAVMSLLNATAAPREFFSLLVNHTAEGFYSDPGNGGNRNGVAWKMIGFTERLAG